MTYTLEDGNRLRTLLRAAPDKDPNQRRMDKQAIVKFVFEDIAAMQARGYTLEEVAELLRTGSFEGDAADAQELPAAGQEDEDQRRRQGAAALVFEDVRRSGPRREAKRREDCPRSLAERGR